MKIENEKVVAALAALESCRNRKEYERAKRLVFRLDRLEQLAMVDSMKSARARVEAV